MTRPVESRLRGTFQASVLSNRQLCPDHYLLVLEVAGFPPSRPGQFVNVRCGAGGPVPGAVEVDWPGGRMPRLAGEELLSRRPLLRRPFSLAGRRDRDDDVELDIIHHAVGVGTRWLAKRAVGDELDLAGPLGNGFTIFPDRPAAAVVGGGVGIPPLLYLADDLGKAGKEVVAFAGARTARLLPLSTEAGEPPCRSGRPTMCTGEFAARGAASVVATDDGSLGVVGLIHEAFARWLEQQARAGEELAVYACGPEPMMRAVAELCARRDVPCQLALERHMACGVGTCQGCVVKVTDGSPAGWRYKLACTDGPVFEARELIWE